MFLLILVALFPLIALIATGYFVKRTVFVEDSFWQGAEKLNYYVLFPAMLFANLADAEIKLSAIQNVVVTLSIVFFIGLIALYALKAIYKTRTQQFGVYVQSNLRFNSYIGIAVVAALFHQPGMTIFAILLVLGIPIVNIFSVLALTHSGKMNPLQVFISLLKNPLIVGALSGGIFNLSGLQLWDGLSAFLKQLALCSLPLGLMCVGAALSFKGLGSNLVPLWVNTVSRLILIPALAYITCVFLKIPQLEMQVLVLFFALPTASSAYILTKVLGGDSQLMAGVISLQTLIAAFTLPFVLFIIY
jgi:malonate transporter and related proteins